MSETMMLRGWWHRNKAALVSHTVLLPVAVAQLLLFAWMVSTALKQRSEVFSLIPQWLPKTPVFSNFLEAWRAAPFADYYRNTVIVTCGLVLVQLVTMTLAAYAFGRLTFPGRDALFVLFLVQLMIPPQSLILPNYLTVKALGLLDTRLAIAMPYFGTAFGTFLLRQTFKSVPRELEHAARIDGCGHLRFLWHVLVPLARPTLFAFALVSIVSHWNDFFWPLIVTDTAKSRTLTIGLAMLEKQVESGGEWTIMMAATLIVILPPMLVFLVFQRQFIQSFMHSGLKG
jgi:sn-glycerol 3-phosphate transport system permease protein